MRRETNDVFRDIWRDIVGMATIYLPVALGFTLFFIQFGKHMDEVWEERYNYKIEKIIDDNNDGNANQEEWQKFYNVIGREYRPELNPEEQKYTCEEIFNYIKFAAKKKGIEYNSNRDSMITLIEKVRGEDIFPEY